MPIKKDELVESNGPINILERMKDGMAYTVHELYEILNDKSIESDLTDFEEGVKDTDTMVQILTNVSITTLNLSNLSYKIYREIEKGTIGQGKKDDVVYYFKK